MDPSILIISGDAEVRDALPWLAAASGFTVEVADVGTRAMERLQYGALPLAVLIDLALRGVPAHAVLRAVGGRYPDLPVVMIGDDVSEGEETVLLRLGASSIVSRRALASELAHILDALARRPPARPPFRAHQRIAVKLPIEVQVGTDRPYEAHQTRDLSRSGVFVPMSAPPPAGTQVRVRLQLLTGEALDLSGEVARRVESVGNAGMAVHFTDCSETARDKLATLLSEYATPTDASTAARPDAAGSSPAPSSQHAGSPNFNLEELLADAQTLATDDPPTSTLVQDSVLPGGPAEADTNVALGERLLRIGSSALAQKRFAKALEHDPGSNRIQFLHALAGAREATRLKQQEQAVECYLQALALDPDCAEALEATRTVDEGRGGKKGFFKKLFSRS